jgi:hypothetical protein
VLEQSLADCVKGRADLLRNATATQLRVVELEQELKKIREAAAAADKKKLKDELVEERRKTQEADAQFNTASIGKIKILPH